MAKHFKSIFAKLFEIDEAQVLLTKNYDDEKDEYLITEDTRVNGIRCARSVSFRKEKDAQTMFDTYNDVWANDYYETAKKLITEKS